MRGLFRRRISVAAMCCYWPGARIRLIYRPRFRLLLKGARKSFSWQDYRDPLRSAFTDPDHLTRTLRRGLAHIQRHPELIDGCLTETGLTLTPTPPEAIRKDQ
ncbi:hypothetical protein ACIA7S_36650 [Streptomyces sp. NPDC051643]|uniref:hypothetical protein n=1 Tax=Streptomyces sp. NPDC051643 TaxID=3365665 RepID=UPI0037AE61C3